MPDTTDVLRRLGAIEHTLREHGLLEKQKPEPECTCYEFSGGHQQGCPMKADREAAVLAEAVAKISAQELQRHTEAEQGKVEVEDLLSIIKNREAEIERLTIIRRAHRNQIDGLHREIERLKETCRHAANQESLRIQSLGEPVPSLDLPALARSLAKSCGMNEPSNFLLRELESKLKEAIGQ